MRFRNFIKNLFPILEMGRGFSPQEDRGWGFELNDGAKNLISIVKGPQSKQNMAFKWILWQGLVNASKQRDKLVEVINASGKLSEPIHAVDLFSQIAHQRIRTKKGETLGELWEREIKHQWQEPQEMILDDGTKILINKANEVLVKLGLEPFYYGGTNGFMQFLEKADFGTKFSKGEINSQQGPDLSDGKFVQLGDGKIVPEFVGFTPPAATEYYKDVLKQTHHDMASNLENEKETLSKFKSSNVITKSQHQIDLQVHAGFVPDNADGEQTGVHTEEEVEGQLQAMRIGLEQGTFDTINPIDENALKGRAADGESDQLISSILTGDTKKTKNGYVDVIQTFYKFNQEQVEKILHDITAGWKQPKKIYRRRVKNPCVLELNGSKKNIDISARSCLAKAIKVLSYSEVAKMMGVNEPEIDIYSLKIDDEIDYQFSANFVPKGIALPLQQIVEELEAEEVDGKRSVYHVEDNDVDKNGNSKKSILVITNGFRRVQIKKTGQTIIDKKKVDLWQQLTLDEKKPYKVLKSKNAKGEFINQPHGWLPPGKQFPIKARGNTLNFSQGHQTPADNATFDTILRDMKRNPEEWGDTGRTDKLIASLEKAARDGIADVSMRLKLAPYIINQKIGDVVDSDPENEKTLKLSSAAYVYATKGLLAISGDDRILYGDEWKKWTDFDPEYVEKINNASITNKLQSNNSSKENYVPEDVLEKLRKSGLQWRLNHIGNYVSRNVQKELKGEMKLIGQDADGNAFDHSDRKLGGKGKNVQARTQNKTDVLDTDISKAISRIENINEIKMRSLRVAAVAFKNDDDYSDTYNKYKEEIKDDAAPTLESKFRAIKGMFKNTPMSSSGSTTPNHEISDGAKMMGMIDAFYDALIDRKVLAWRGVQFPDLTPVLKRFIPTLIGKEKESLNHDDWHPGETGTNLLYNIDEFNNITRSFVQKTSKQPLPSDSDQIKNSNTEFDDTPSSELTKEIYKKGYAFSDLVEKLGKATEGKTLKTNDDWAAFGSQFLPEFLENEKWKSAIEVFKIEQGAYYAKLARDIEKTIPSQPQPQPQKIISFPQPQQPQQQPQVSTAGMKTLSALRRRPTAQQQPQQPQQPQPRQIGESTQTLKMTKFNEWISKKLER